MGEKLSEAQKIARSFRNQYFTMIALSVRSNPGDLKAACDIAEAAMVAILEDMPAGRATLGSSDG